VAKIITDDVAQMSYYRGQGYFRNAPEPHADLGEIVAGIKPGRNSDNERTMTINLGLGIEDIATALLVYDKAREKGIGVELSL
jgi:ornithine cyclodeaminase/alanine dehydrogenase-like protein (mu-crystallin family)